MAAENQDFETYKGEDKDIVFPDIVDVSKNRLIQMETISEAWWSLGTYEDLSGEAVLIVSTDPSRDYNNIGSTVLLVEDGRIMVNLTGATMADIEPGFYTHELRVINSGREYVLSRGKVLIKSKILAI